MATTFGAVLSLKDNFTVTMRKAQKEQSKFKRDVEKTKAELEKAYKQKYELRLKNASAHKSINSLMKKLQPLRKHTINMIAKTQFAMAMISKVSAKLNPLKKAHSILLKGKDAITPLINKAKSGIKALSSMAKGITIGAVAGGGAMLGKGIKDGAMMEKQMVSMEHFIGINNQGKSKDEIKSMTDKYINDLRTNANSTPFTTNEVISAGTRALNVAGGDTSMAQSFLRLAEDMSALNPEKSLSDAMEALADLKVGETERMKEFGFKISADDFKASGGDFSKLTNSEGIALTEMFKGGAEKLSTTGSGLASTILGKMGSGLTDMGKATLDALKPVLEKGVEFADVLAPKLARFGTVLGEGIGKAIELFNKLRPVFSNIANLFKERMEAIKPIIQSFVGFVKSVFPIVKDIIATVGNKVGEIFSHMSTNSKGLTEAFQKAFPVIQDVLKVAWDIMKPILNLLGDGIMILWDCFNIALNGIVDVVSWVWDKIRPIFELITGAVEGITGAVQSTISTVKGWFGKDSEVKVTGDNGGKKRAMGVARVPYDNYPIMAHEGEVLLTKQEAKGVGNGKTIIEKLADTIVVREDADIDRIVNALVRKLEVSSMAYGGA